LNWIYSHYSDSFHGYLCIKTGCSIFLAISSSISFNVSIASQLYLICLLSSIAFYIRSYILLTTVDHFHSGLIKGAALRDGRD